MARQWRAHSPNGLELDGGLDRDRNWDRNRELDVAAAKYISGRIHSKWPAMDSSRAPWTNNLVRVDPRGGPQRPPADGARATGSKSDS